MKKIVICADDYGYNHAVSKGILELIKARRISATSCMTNRDSWVSDAPAIKAYLQTADIGLHLNLTEGKPLTAMPSITIEGQLPSVGELIKRVVLRKAKLAELSAEINAQLDAFEHAMGCVPAYIDGHQHVHHLPMVRQVLLAIYEKRLRQHQVYVRVSMTNWRQALTARFPDSFLIATTGALKFRNLLQRFKVPHNTSFAGYYRFEQAQAYADIFPELLAQSKTGGLIMCHPGAASNDKNDAIANSRPYELAYFNSEQFSLDCQQANVKVVRFNELA